MSKQKSETKILLLQILLWNCWLCSISLRMALMRHLFTRGRRERWIFCLFLSMLRLLFKPFHIKKSCQFRRIFSKVQCITKAIRTSRVLSFYVLVSHTTLIDRILHITIVLRLVPANSSTKFLLKENYQNFMKFHDEMKMI